MFGLSSGSGIGSESGLNPTIVRVVGLHTLYIHIYAWLHPAAPGSDSGCAWLPGTQVKQLFVLTPRGTQQPRGKKFLPWRLPGCVLISRTIVRVRPWQQPSSLAAERLRPAARLRRNKPNNCACSYRLLRLLLVNFLLDSARCLWETVGLL